MASKTARSRWIFGTAGCAAIAASSLLLACCNPTVTSKPSPNGATSTNKPDTNENAGPGPAPVDETFVDPWGRAQVGDTAVYVTTRDSAGETWVLVEYADAPKIKKTWGAGEDPFGNPDPGQSETVTENPMPSETNRKWWTAKRPANLKTSRVTLADGATAVDAYTVTTDAGTYVISDAVPFEGIVSFTPKGADAPTMQLKSFSLGTGTLSGK